MTSSSFDALDRPEWAADPPDLADVPEDRPRVDQEIFRDALRAKAGDRPVRDALYGLFRPTMARFVLRYGRIASEAAAWELDDIWQETFLAFAEVVGAWPGTGDFVAYYYAVFPRRLAAAVRRLEGSQPWVNRGASVEAGYDPRRTIETRALVMDYVATLPLVERQILAQHVWEELPLASVAANLGLSLSETLRRWRGIRRTAHRHFVTSA